MYFLRDWQSYNIDWRQMAQVGGDWTGFAVETAFSWTVQPIFEGGIEMAFHIQTGDYMAAAGTGIGIGAEMTAGKIVRGVKTAKEGLKAAKEVVNKTPRRPTKEQRENALDRSRDADGVERCTYCDQPLDRRSGSSNSAEIDHKKAYSRGGETVDENLDASCRTCNRSKGAKALGTEWVPPNER